MDRRDFLKLFALSAVGLWVPKRTYIDFVGDYYDRQERDNDFSGEDDLKVYDQGNWVPIQTFLKKRS